MSDLMMEFPDTVSDARGTFRAWAMAGEGRDGRWEGWLEFVPADRDTSIVYATPIEMRREDRANASELLFSLEEVVEALDRRNPQSERVGEAEITADADRLRACAMQRIALLRPRNNDQISQTGSAPRKDHQMKGHRHTDNHVAVSEWEDDGGARGSDTGRRTGNAPPVGDKRRPQQERFDASHQSDTRGEHRYSDLHQTGAEQEARQERDDLKQRLAKRSNQPPR